MSSRVLWLLSLLISPIPALAQLSSPQFQLDPAKSTPPTFTVQGVVVNSVTGLPVHAALVQIYFPRQNSQLTAADGRFRFEGIPQAQINLTVRKPGFFSEQELRRSVPYIDHPIQVGPDMPPVILTLVPEGVIYGRVTGSDGEPINNLSVRLLYGALIEGERSWQERGGSGGQTNDQGEFRLFGLEPGTYYLEAGPMASPMPLTGRAADPPQGYAAAYYGGGSDISSAAPIAITPGKQVSADLSMKSAPFHQISGLVVGTPAGMPANVQLFTPDGQAVPIGFRTNPQDGAFTVFVSSGSYVLKAMVSGKGGLAGVGSQPLTVTGDTAGIRLAVGPTAILPVAVELRSTRNIEPSPQPSERQMVGVQLISQGSIQRNMRSATMEGPPENRSLAIRNVEPGAYRVRINPFGPWYVESARRGPVNLLTDDLTIDAGDLGAPIEIVLRDDLASLTGTILARGQPAQGVVILARDSRALAPITFAVGPQGKFQRRDLPPGEYRVFAFDRIDGLEYANPEAMRSFSSAAQLVRLAPNGEAMVNLELQTRGE
jgi:hypothetical protein